MNLLRGTLNVVKSHNPSFTRRTFNVMKSNTSLITKNKLLCNNTHIRQNYKNNLLTKRMLTKNSKETFNKSNSTIYYDPVKMIKIVYGLGLLVSMPMYAYKYGSNLSSRAYHEYSDEDRASLKYFASIGLMTITGTSIGIFFSFFYPIIGGYNLLNNYKENKNKKN